MNTTTNANTNGRSRKSLAEQIDRLDQILDGLAEGLNEAVASAVKEAVGLAVQETVRGILAEVLTNVELQKRLTTSQGPDTQPRTPAVVRIADRARRCWAWLVGAAKGTWDKIIETAQAVGARLKAVARSAIAAGSTKIQRAREEISRRVRSGWMLTVALAALAKRFRAQLLVALGVGVLVGVACYLGGREIASVGCGLAGFAGSLATGAVSRLRRMLQFLAASES